MLLLEFTEAGSAGKSLLLDWSWVTRAIEQTEHGEWGGMQAGAVPHIVP